jgi:uncharacterized protein YukE
MWVDSHRLRQAAPQFTAVAGELDAVFRRLSDALDAEDGCWGGDATGQAFAKEYSPASQQTIQVGHEVTDAIEDVGARLENAADLADAADLRASGRLT